MAEHQGPSAAQVAKRLIILRTMYIVGYLTPPIEVIDQFKEQESSEEFAETAKEIQRHIDEVWDSARSLDLWDEASEKERIFSVTLFQEVTPRQITTAYWSIESIQVLMWCLSLLDDLPAYDTPANDEILSAGYFRDSLAIVESAKLRPREQIEKARNLAEFWHWRDRQRELHEMGRPGIDEINRKTARALIERGEGDLVIDEDFGAKGKAYRDLTDDEWSEVHSITIERHVAFNWVCGYAPNDDWASTPTDT